MNTDAASIEIISSTGIDNSNSMPPNVRRETDKEYHEMEATQPRDTERLEMLKMFDEYFKKMDAYECQCSSVHEKLQEMSAKIDNNATKIDAVIRNIESNNETNSNPRDGERLGLTQISDDYLKQIRLSEFKDSSVAEKLLEMSTKIENNAAKIDNITKRMERIIRSVENHNSSMTRLLRMNDALSKPDEKKDRLNSA